MRCAVAGRFSGSRQEQEYVQEYEQEQGQEPRQEQELQYVQEFQ